MSHSTAIEAAGRLYPELDLAAENQRLLAMSATERMRWAIARFGARTAVLASMQKTSSLLLHALAGLPERCEVLFVDTGYHFPETLAIRDHFAREYGLDIVSLLPALSPAQQRLKYGYDLHEFVDGQPDCCRMRKEVPFIDHVRASGIRLVMLGLRRGEGGARGTLQPLALDPRYDGYVLHPFVDWDDAQVEAYLEQHDVPVNALHAQGYPSIGCTVCTTPVLPGEDERAGRWRHLRSADGQPRYCGLNSSDGGGI
jgi:phosphoadenosine phosphosulfate reductase